MLKKVIKTSELSKQELRNIKNLVQLCQQYDNFPVKLYWNILSTRQIPEFDDFLYFQDGKLIGYLALFVFKDDEAELNALVHPNFRRRMIFSQLLQDAANELKRRHINYCLFICPQQATVTLNFVGKFKDAKFDHTECQMHLVGKPKIDAKEAPPVELQVATKEDIPQMAQIDNACFNTTYDRIVFRFLTNFKEKNRTAYLASVDGREIGKTHIRIDDNDKVFIHDLCVLPEFRRKHYAIGMVLTLIAMLRKQGFKTIYLDVLGENKNAIKLYEKCGFIITGRHDFWKVPVESL